ncbi:MFS transporter [Amaricoccus sp.]|uniref:MFS transporter n=1 Tax=Amaricoccus sp. TaxID=1872485 RepID=UPI001B766FEC|nr:MFS transporter [Amaricoccus sp.]MBP7001567.1 MFS transporter [Amaricoccus sp.]
MIPAVLSRPGLHTTAFYIAFFMAMGVHAPFWPLWLAHWGLTPAEVGVYVAIGTGVRVVAGLALPAWADRLDGRRAVVAGCAAVAGVTTLLHLWISDRAELLAATVVLGAAFAAIGPIAEALGVAASRAFGFPYAQTRGLGSLGFLAANLAVGALIAPYGVNLALWWIVVCMVLVVALVAGHPGGRRAPGATPPRFADIGRLLVDRTFFLFVATVAFTQASHSVFFALASVHWARIGISPATIGGLWAASVAGEIVFMVAIGGWTVARLGAIGAIAVSGLAGVARWGIMALDPPVWALWPLQLCHTLTFALGHLGAIAFIARAVPPRLGASAQGAMTSLATGSLMLAGMLAAAAAYPAFGGGVFAIAAAFSAVGVGLAALLARRWRGETLPV